MRRSGREKRGNKQGRARQTLQQGADQRTVINKKRARDKWKEAVRQKIDKDRRKP